MLATNNNQVDTSSGRSAVNAGGISLAAPQRSVADARALSDMLAYYYSDPPVAVRLKVLPSGTSNSGTSSLPSPASMQPTISTHAAGPHHSNYQPSAALNQHACQQRHGDVQHALHPGSGTASLAVLTPHAIAPSHAAPHHDSHYLRGNEPTSSSSSTSAGHHKHDSSAKSTAASNSSTSSTAAHGGRDPVPCSHSQHNGPSTSSGSGDSLPLSDHREFWQSCSLFWQHEPQYVPAPFVCPLSRSVMREPVIARDGVTYEKSAIQSWFKAGNTQSPVTKQAMNSRGLLPNDRIRRAIHQWRVLFTTPQA